MRSMSPGHKPHVAEPQPHRRDMTRSSSGPSRGSRATTSEQQLAADDFEAGRSRGRAPRAAAARRPSASAIRSSAPESVAATGAQQPRRRGRDEWPAAVSVARPSRRGPRATAATRPSSPVTPQPLRRHRAGDRGRAAASTSRRPPIDDVRRHDRQPELATAAASAEREQALTRLIPHDNCAADTHPIADARPARPHPRPPAARPPPRDRARVESRPAPSCTHPPHPQPPPPPPRREANTSARPASASQAPRPEQRTAVRAGDGEALEMPAAMRASRRRQVAARHMGRTPHEDSRATLRRWDDFPRRAALDDDCGDGQGPRGTPRRMEAWRPADPRMSFDCRPGNRSLNMLGRQRNSPGRPPAVRPARARRPASNAPRALGGRHQGQGHAAGQRKGMSDRCGSRPVPRPPSATPSPKQHRVSTRPRQTASKPSGREASQASRMASNRHRPPAPRIQTMECAPVRGQARDCSPEQHSTDQNAVSARPMLIRSPVQTCPQRPPPKECAGAAGRRKRGRGRTHFTASSFTFVG